MNLRDVILDHTDRLLARFGYARFTMDDLARAVGIGKGTIYLYFRGKEDVTLSVIDRNVVRVESVLSTVATLPVSPSSRLRAMLEARVLERYDHVAHYQDSLQELVGSLRSALNARREQLGGREAAIFATVIAEGTRVGEFTSAKALATARLLMTGTDALVPSNLSARELQDRPALAARAKALAALLVAGLQSRSGAQPYAKSSVSVVRPQRVRAQKRLPARVSR